MIRDFPYCKLVSYLQVQGCMSSSNNVKLCKIEKTTWELDVHSKLSTIPVCACDKKHAQFHLRACGRVPVRSHALNEKDCKQNRDMTYKRPLHGEEIRHFCN